MSNLLQFFTNLRLKSFVAKRNNYFYYEFGVKTLFFVGFLWEINS